MQKIDAKLEQQFLKWKSNFSIREINLGLTNKNYILDEKWFLRKSQLDTKKLTNRKNEITILPFLSKNRIGLKVFYYFWDQDKNFNYLTRYLKKTTTFRKEKKNKINLKKVATLIKKLQSLQELPQSLTKFNFKENLMAHLSTSIAKLASNWQEKINFLFQFLEKLDKNQTVLAHNDLVGENILVTQQKKYYLIDFEYCSLNYLEYDIAVFACENKLFLSADLWQYWLKLFNFTEKNKEKRVLYFMFYRELLVYFWTIKTEKAGDYQKKLHLRKEKEKIIHYLYQVLRKD